MGSTNIDPGPCGVVPVEALQSSPKWVSTNPIEVDHESRLNLVGDLVSNLVQPIQGVIQGLCNPEELLTDELQQVLLLLRWNLRVVGHYRFPEGLVISIVYPFIDQEPTDSSSKRTPMYLPATRQSIL